MAYDEPVAHIAEDGRHHILYDHLTGTAEKAAEMAGEFGCSDWGWLAGLWHGLGKYSEDFQQMIRTASELEANIKTKTKVDHSTGGGIHAVIN